MRRLAAELGLGGSVEFAGLLEDPRAAIGRAHVVCLTSDSEGFPNALLEAMAMGRPVVATSVGGIPELVRDGVDGILTDASVDDVARGLERLLGAPATAEGDGDPRRRASEHLRARADGRGCRVRVPDGGPVSSIESAPAVTEELELEAAVRDTARVGMSAMGLRLASYAIGFVASVMIARPSVRRGEGSTPCRSPCSGS